MRRGLDAGVCQALGQAVDLVAAVEAPGEAGEVALGVLRGVEAGEAAIGIGLEDSGIAGQVPFATLTWVDWFNNRRLLEPIGNIPPAEAEERYYALLDEQKMAA